jgi:hypothetical protein
VSIFSHLSKVLIVTVNSTSTTIRTMIRTWTVLENYTLMRVRRSFVREPFLADHMVY